MSPHETFVIVGASLAGAKAAEELRERGFEGRVVLIGSEPERPYERPPLSKDYLRGESDRARAYVHEDGFYDEQAIELLTGTTVTAIDVGGARVTLDTGVDLAYDRLLLATGAEPRRIPLPAGTERVETLRTLADCDRLRERLASGGRVAVVGAGWIGSEVAASARQRGLEVTLIDPSPRPNERIFGAEMGAFFRDLHARNGVELALGERVESITDEGALVRVRTEAGRVVECDFAVVGIGVTPRVALAEAAGLAVGDGVLVDEALRTSAADVFAAGDVAAAWHPFYGERIRVEHWANALEQGPAAARSMLGEATSYDAIPFFFSDQYDVGLEYSGDARRSDRLVVRGAPASGEFLAFWLAGGRVVAGMNVNVWDVADDIKALIRGRRVVDAEALADPATPLAALIGEAPGAPGEHR